MDTSVAGSPHTVPVYVYCGWCVYDAITAIFISAEIHVCCCELFLQFLSHGLAVK